MFSKAHRILLALVLAPSLLLAQSSTKDKAPKGDTASLAKPVDMGIGDYRFFEDQTRGAKVRLVTSWIPGEKHEGMFRYKMDLWVVDSFELLLDDESAQTLLKRISACLITLNLYDKDDFILRRHVVPLMQGVDPKHVHLTALNANDAFQMDAEEYRKFTTSGSWNIGWSCGGLAP